MRATFVPLRARCISTTACLLGLVLLTSSVQAQEDLDLELDFDRLTILRGTLRPSPAGRIRVTPQEIQILGAPLTFEGTPASSGGGKIEGGLDTGDLVGTSDHKLFHRDVPGLATPFAELEIQTSAVGMITARAVAYGPSGALVSTAAVELPLSSFTQIGLRWWESPNAGSTSGGIAVEIDGVIATCRCGISNWTGTGQESQELRLQGKEGRHVGVTDLVAYRDPGIGCPVTLTQCWGQSLDGSLARSPGGAEARLAASPTSARRHPETARSPGAPSGSPSSGAPLEPPPVAAGAILDDLRNLLGEIWNVLRLAWHTLGGTLLPR